MPERPMYNPEVIAHEAGHHAYQKQLGKAKVPIDVASLGAALGGLGLTTAGVLKQRHGLTAAGGALSAASFLPRLIEEGAASKKGLEAIKSTLSEEELAQAEKRLRTAWATYAAVPAVAATGTGLAIGSGIAARARKFRLSSALGRAGAITALVGAASAPFLQQVLHKSFREGEGKLIPREEAQALGKRIAPDVETHLLDRPTPMGAFYVPTKEKRLGNFATKMMRSQLEMMPELSDAQVERLVSSGGIVAAPLVRESKRKKASLSVTEKACAFHKSL